MLVAAGVSIAASHGPPHSSRSCPVTLPNHVATPPFGLSKKNGYRQGQIAVELWPLGVTLVGKHEVKSDGSLAVKVPWYRYGRGRLRITAARIDKPGHAARTSVPSGYGRTGFQASGIYFPSEGCWKVTATVGRSHLTYVTIVMKAQTLRQEVPSG
jgi:hypothetical protein